MLVMTVVRGKKKAQNARKRSDGMDCLLPIDDDGRNMKATVFPYKYFFFLTCSIYRPRKLNDCNLRNEFFEKGIRRSNSGSWTQNNSSYELRFLNSSENTNSRIEKLVQIFFTKYKEAHNRQTQIQLTVV